jgi:nucleoside-diphosphate-sugar epimerase
MTTMSETKLILGCGYLGRRVATAWHAVGANVYAVTRSVVRAEDFRQEGWTPIIADVCDPKSLSQLPVADTVLYAIGYDRGSGHTQHEVAVEGLRNVLAHLRCRKFVFISSSSVYGQSAGEWVDETSSCRPTQPGGECCLAAEQLVRDAMPTANVLRLSGIYGPQRLLSKVETLTAGVPLTGRPDAWLNLIHVDDAVNTVLAVETRSEPAATYLVSDDEPVRRGDYYAHLAALIGAPPPTFDDSQPAKRGSGGLNKRCRNRKLRDVLGVTLRYPTYREGLSAAVYAS